MLEEKGGLALSISQNLLGTPKYSFKDDTSMASSLYIPTLQMV